MLTDTFRRRPSTPPDTNPAGTGRARTSTAVETDAMAPTGDVGAPQPTMRRPALVVLVAAASTVCLILGYWQWGRFTSTGGTGQNLGYTFQWPLFAAFVVFAYRRFVHLEDATSTPTTRDSPAPTPTEIPADVLPPRLKLAPADTLGDDTESRQMAQYNTYLAELAARGRRSADRASAASGIRRPTLTAVTLTPPPALRPGSRARTRISSTTTGRRCH